MQAKTHFNDPVRMVVISALCFSNAYSARALTHDSDVLSTLTGLASAISITHDCTYLNGLWQEDLQVGLCWYIVDLRYRKSDLQTSKQNPALSWTWISQRSRQIAFLGWRNDHTVTGHEGVLLIGDRAKTHSQKTTNQPEVSFSSEP